MKENVIIVNCNVPSEAYQILSKLRQDAENDSYEISQAAVVKMDAGHLSVEDAFIVDDPLESRSLAGNLIGSLVGVLGGPVGVLLGGLGGALIGDSIDEQKMEEKTALLEKASKLLTDGETALLLYLKEADETALGAMLKNFQITITRMDAAEIASEIKYAENKELPKNETAAELPEGETPAAEEK